VANDFANQLFQNNKIKFIDILEIIKRTKNHFKTQKVKSLDHVYEIINNVNKYLKQQWN
jgi:1-deoxy-D-xylulose 5-phosphate reductoisomerase